MVEPGGQGGQVVDVVSGDVEFVIVGQRDRKAVAPEGAGRGTDGADGRPGGELLAEADAGGVDGENGSAAEGLGCRGDSGAEQDDEEDHAHVEPGAAGVQVVDSSDSRQDHD